MVTKNLFETEESYSNRQKQAEDRELQIREAIDSAMRSGDEDAELQAREALEAFKYASRSVGSPRLESGLQGATFGFSDELSAGLQSIPGWIKAKMEDSPASYGDIYSENVAPIRESLKQYQQENPVESLGLQVAGGLPTGYGLAKGMYSLFPGISRLSAIPQTSLLGGVFGGIAGAGHAEGGLKERLTGGAVGGGVGTVGGGILGLAGQAANRYIAQPIMNALRSDKTAAQKAVLGSLADDALTPQTASRELGRLGPEATIADLGKTTQSLAGSAARYSGRAGQQAEKVLQSRVEGGPKRLRQALRSILGNDKAAKTEFESIAASRKAQAAPLYKQAHEELLTLDDELTPLLKKAGASTYNKALRIFNTDPDAPNIKWPSYKEIEKGKTIPLAVADYMKRALSGASRSVGGNKEMGGAQGKLAERLTAALNDRSEAYNQARQIYASKSRLLDALKSGKDVLKDDPDDIASLMGGLNKSEQEAYRTGAISAIENKLKSVNIGSDASKKVIRSELLKERLKEAFPDEESLNAFVSAAERENRFAVTRNEVLRGSQTRARQAADARFISQQTEAVGRDIADGNFGTAARKIISGVSANKSLPSEQLAKNIADIIFAQGDDAMRLLNEINKQVPKLSAKQKEIVKEALSIVTAEQGGAQSQKLMPPQISGQ